jgi:hypothetical protein
MIGVEKIGNDLSTCFIKMEEIQDLEKRQEYGERLATWEESKGINQSPSVAKSMTHNLPKVLHELSVVYFAALERLKDYFTSQPSTSLNPLMILK